MPERDSALSKYQKFAQDQQSQLETIQVEFNNKYLDYQTNAETLSESAKQLKERELQDLQKRIRRLPAGCRTGCAENAAATDGRHVFTKAQETTI